MSGSQGNDQPGFWMGETEVTEDQYLKFEAEFKNFAGAKPFAGGMSCE